MTNLASLKRLAMPVVFVLFAGSILGLAVACAPNKNRVEIKAGASSSLKAGIEQCTKSMNKVLVTREKAGTVDVCQIQDENKKIGTKRTSEVRFRIDRERAAGDRAQASYDALIQIKVKLDLSKTAYTQKEYPQLKTALNDCVNRIDRFLFRRPGNVRLRIDWLSELATAPQAGNGSSNSDSGGDSVSTAASDEEFDYDQILTLIPKPGDVGTKALVMEEMPNRSDLYPFGLNGDKSCSKCTRNEYGRVDSDCLSACWKIPSEPFCRNLAKMVGHWIGFSDTSEGNFCLNAAPTPAENPSFMRGWLVADQIIIPPPRTNAPSRSTEHAREAGESGEFLDSDRDRGDSGDDDTADLPSAVVARVSGTSNPPPSGVRSLNTPSPTAPGHTSENNDRVSAQPVSPAPPTSSAPVSESASAVQVQAHPLIGLPDRPTLRILSEDPFWKIPQFSKAQLARILKPVCPNVDKPVPQPVRRPKQRRQPIATSTSSAPQKRPAP